MYREKTMHIANFKGSRMPNGMIRVRTRVSVLTEGWRHGRGTVMKLRDMGDRQCLKLSGLL